MRSIEWAKTPIGSPEGWPSSLKTAVRIMLTSQQPIWIGWGPKLSYLYNDAYKSIVGRKHPWALGLPTSVVWREIWDDIAPMLAQASRGHEGTYVEAQLLIMERNGYPEEVFVDANQLEVSIINVAVNARDAMQGGGKLTAETANVSLDETYAASQSEVAAGEYVVLCITDTGAGMTREVRARAFEPFFTTKDLGQGTGLGLSQVYGFVKQPGGHVKLYSEVGRGTAVKLYLPRHDAPAGAAMETQLASAALRSADGETILVLEDDDDVRECTTGILRELGYKVLEAPNAVTALRIVSGNSRIDLLFTDVGLPGGINGKHLADAARNRRPDLKVVFTSGYVRNAIVHDGRLDPGVLLITKPFTYAALASKTSDVLDPAGKPSRILVVEDEELIRIFAADCLEQPGYKVETAISATEAINKIRGINGEFDLAIIGVGLADRKRELLVGELLEIHPRLAIAIVSGADVSDLRRRFPKVNHIDFLQKPYSRDQLQALASRFCST